MLNLFILCEQHAEGKVAPTYSHLLGDLYLFRLVIPFTDWANNVYFLTVQRRHNAHND